LVQPAGEPQAGLERLDWQDALQTYRPFLSHAELEAFFREPSHVYDLLSSVLGLEPLTAAATFLATARKQRENTSAEVKKAVPALLEQVRAIDDERATTCAQELSAKRPDPERVRLAAAGAVTSARQLLDSRSDATAGLWPRACAFLARQALEAAVDEIWAARPSTSGMTKCKMRSQLICLPAYLPGCWSSSRNRLCLFRSQRGLPLPRLRAGPHSRRDRSLARHHRPPAHSSRRAIKLASAIERIVESILRITGPRFGGCVVKKS
jgi:hypothetical protein